MSIFQCPNLNLSTRWECREIEIIHIVSFCYTYAYKGRFECPRDGCEIFNIGINDQHEQLERLMMDETYPVPIPFIRKVPDVGIIGQAADNLAGRAVPISGSQLNALASESDRQTFGVSDTSNTYVCILLSGNTGLHGSMSV